MKGEEKKNVEARGLRWYSTSHTLIDRDVNAVKNILDCYLLKERPKNLTRNSATTVRHFVSLVGVKDKARESKSYPCKGKRLVYKSRSIMLTANKN